MQVPHYYQSSEQTCGAACLRMLLAVHGVFHDESTIAQHVGMTPFGTTVNDLVDGARSLGFGSDLLPVHGEPDALAALSNQTPFVAMIDMAELIKDGSMILWHFVIPLGSAHDQVLYHDPADGPDQSCQLDDFLAAWATAGYRGVNVWTP